MNYRNTAAIYARLVTLTSALVFGSLPLYSQSPAPPRPGVAPTPLHWDKVSVYLPVSMRLFPEGDGVTTANSQCLICHSVEMVLSQPPRTQAQWTETVNKMRNVYGAPVEADQVETLAKYFTQVVGH
jgi:hypothetical protein